MQLYGQVLSTTLPNYIPITPEKAYQILDHLGEQGYTWVSGLPTKNPTRFTKRRIDRAEVKYLNIGLNKLVLTSNKPDTEIGEYNFITPEEPLTVPQIFDIFLREHQVLTEYRKLVKLGLLERHTIVIANDLIIAPIHWSSSKYPTGRWSTLNKKWRKLCQELNLPNKRISATNV